MSRKKECQDFSRNADDPTASPNSGPGLIPDIIPHLCKFLVIKDIKDCRLVCKSWNYEATPVLKERTLINIRLDAGTYGKTPPKEWELDERIAEKLSFNTNIKISANKSLSPPKNLQDFPPIRNLKSILVQIKITEQWQKDFCNEIILGSAPTLEELQLHCDQNFPSFSATVFPRLKKLVINGGRTRAQLDPVIERIGQAVTEAFPALQCFTINCEHLYEISKLELLQHFPLSLSSLVLRGYLDSDQTGCLLKIPSPLKRLDLKAFYHKTGHRAHELPSLLHKLLQKHCLTPEKLELHLGSNDKKVEWKFPALPALKKFTIYFCTMFQKFEFESGLGSGKIDYAVCFPVLQTLHIHSFDFSTYFFSSYDFSSFSAFIPPEDEEPCPVVKSLREFNINIFWYKETNELAQAALYPRLVDIFPYAKICINN